MLSVYLYFRGQKKPLKPSLDLLFQYGVTASFNYVLTRLLLMVPQKLLGVSCSVDSAHYALAALLSAWLLAQLYRAGKHVKVSLDVTRVDGGKGSPAEPVSEPAEEPRHEEAGKQ